MLLCDSRVSGMVCSPYSGVYVGGMVTQNERMRTVKETGELSMETPQRARALRRVE